MAIEPETLTQFKKAVVEVDKIVKARKAIDPKFKGWERGLEALSKELRMKKNGKQLLPDLKRAQVL